LASIQAMSMLPGLSMGRPKALSHTRLRQHPIDLETAKTTV